MGTAPAFRRWKPLWLPSLFTETLLWPSRFVPSSCPTHPPTPTPGHLANPGCCALVPPPVGSQDSLLEITFRSGGLPVLCDPTTPQPEDLPSPPPGAGLAELAHPAGSPLGRRDCLVKLECFRFLPPPAGPLLGGLELLKFRESGIASEYESNTDESEERDSWSQEELPRLLNVLQRQELGDSLDEEIAV